MSEEVQRRRAGFREGPAIRLADGQAWTFPAPREGAQEADEPGLAGLVRAVFEAEDRSDRLRCELALAIHLLSRNYHLSPAEYRALLRFRPDSRELQEAQASFHGLAVALASRFWPALEPAPMVSARPVHRPGWLRGLTRLWRGGRPAPGRLAAPGGP